MATTQAVAVKIPDECQTMVNVPSVTLLLPPK
jgi:hypothetical protein